MDLFRTPSLFILLTSLISAYPDSSHSFEGYIELGLAKSHSNPDINRLSNGIFTSDSLDKRGEAGHISLGTAITENLMAEISYRDFGTTLSDSDSLMKQESVSYDLQLKYRFFTQGKWSFHGLFGIANWHSKLKQELWLQVNPSLISGAKTEERTLGFSPKLGVGLDYRVTDNLSIGLDYEYYRRLGDGEQMVDQDKLAYGDLVGASTGHAPLKFSQEIYSLNLAYWF
jgi:hypothetical protein